MKKIANFVIDEKFIDWQIDYHDLTQDVCVHDYYFVGYKNFRFIKKNKNRIIIIKDTDVVEVVKSYDAVFLHSLFGLPINIIPQIDAKIKVFWFAWGYDIYNNPTPKPLVNLNLYHPLTKRYIRRDIKGSLYRVLMNIRDNIKRRGWKYYIEAVKRIDYFSGIIPEEYELVRSFCPVFKAKQVDYSYCDITQFSQFDSNDYNFLHGNNIIIGNSTAYTNNHLDVFESIKNIYLGSRKIIAPLSYFPNPRYVKTLKEKGGKYFSDRFIALTDFLPIDEYNKVLNSCGFCIFAIERQQGMGAVNKCLYNGCKVFLYETSIIYKHCQNMGIKVFSIEKDLIDNNAFMPLAYDDAINNRKKICEKISKEVMVNKLYNIYNMINQRNEVK